MSDMIGSGGGGGKPTNTPDNLFSEDVIECLLAISEGPIEGLEKGAQSFYVGTTPLVASDGTTKNFEKFAIGVHPGYPEGEARPFKAHLGGVSSSTSVGVSLLQNTAVTRQTQSVLRGQIDQLEVRIVFSRLLKTTDKGTFAATARFTVEYKLSSSSTWMDFYSQHVIEITGKTTSGYVKEFVKEVSRDVTEDWEIRVTKLSEDNNDEIIVDMVFDTFQSVSKEETTFPDTALVHILGTANGQFSSLPDFSGIYKGRLLSIPTNYNPVAKTYDETTPWNGTFKQAWTDNPAWVLYDLIMNTRYGLAAFRPYINTDRYAFYSASKWCDEQVGSGRPRFTFNDLIQEPRQALEQLSYVAGSFNALCLDDGNGTIHLLVDKDDPAVMLFTPENVMDDGTGGFSYTYTDITVRANDFTVAFINPDLDWNEDRRRIPNVTTNEANILKYGRIPMEFIAVGCTNAEEAVHKAAVRLASSLTETTMVSFTTARQGQLLNIFDVILIADPTMGWSQSGRVSSHDGAHMYFRDQIYIEEVKEYVVKVQTLTGVVEVHVMPEHTGFVNRFSLVDPFPSNAPSFASFTLEETGPFGLAKPFRVTSVQELAEGDGYTYSITASEINRNKYVDADNILDLPAYQYSFRDPLLVPVPLNFTVESGNNQLLLMESGEIITRLLASWQRPRGSRITGYEVQYKASDDENWFDVNRTSSEQMYFTEVITGVDYDVRIRSIAPFGAKSQWLTVENHTVIGKTEPPPDVLAFTLVIKADGTRAFNFSTSGQPPDVVVGGGYRIKYRSAETDLAWSAMTPLHEGVLKSSPYETNTPRDAIYDFGIKAVDSSGNESTTALMINDIIVGDADFLDAKAGTATNSDAMNQLIAKLNAKIASNKAATAQAAAESAIAEIDAISADNVLAKGEKKAISIDYETILNERAGLDAQATTFGVSKVDYDAAVVALTAYLLSLTPAWDDVTQNTPIDAATFKSKFVDLFNARQTMQNAITVAAKALADSAQTAADIANAELTNIASDNVLSKGEKASVILDYNALIGNQTGIVTQATVFGIASTTYTATLTALTSYLTGLSPAWNDLTQNTVIVGATFRTKFADAYAAEQTILNALAAKAKAIADAADTKATNAAADALTANNAATAALLELTNIASDNILSKSEKPVVVMDYNAIINEQSGITTQATSYGVSSTAYASAVSALSSYLTALSPPYTTFTSDTVITGTTFRTNFNNVYTQRQIVLNAIASKAKLLADTADGKAVNAQSTADTAAANALIAKGIADAATTELANIASDNVLSKGEKPAVVKDFFAITAEQSGIVAQATNYGLSHSTYDTAISALTVYLSNLTPAWDLVTTNTPISAALFQQKFNDVYAAKQSLLNAIVAAAKTLADAAQTQANSAQSLASSASSAAIAAQSDATAALNTLTNIVSDNVLSKGEKSAVIKEYSVLVNEKSGIDTQADNLSQSRTAYDTAVTALTTYLTGLSPAYNDVNTDTTIVGSTFRTKFADVYSTRQSLLNAITTKASQIAIWTQVSGTTGAVNTTHITNNATTEVIYYSYTDTSVVGDAGITRSITYTNTSANTQSVIITPSGMINNYVYDPTGEEAYFWVVCGEQRTSDNAIITAATTRHFAQRASTSGQNLFMFFEDCYTVGVGNYLSIAVAVRGGGSGGTTGSVDWSANLVNHKVKLEVIKK